MSPTAIREITGRIKLAIKLIFLEFNAFVFYKDLSRLLMAVRTAFSSMTL
jgi:hypothetical protein